MKALITVGTPHYGAPAATNVQNGVISNMIGGWVDDLAAGPLAFFGNGEEYARDMLEGFGFSGEGLSTDLNTKLQTLYGAAPAVDDLKPGSQFLSTLNSSPNNTLPSVRYSIFGNESKQSNGKAALEYVRLAESANQDRQSPVEDGEYVRYHRGVATFYFLVGSFTTYLSGRYFFLYNNSDTSDPNHFLYYDRAVYFASVARAWYRGFLSLIKYQQKDWDENVLENPHVACYNDDTCKQANDGLLKYETQAPSFFGQEGIDILQANGANHMEETAHPNVKERLQQIFDNSNVNIPEAGNGGGDDGGGGSIPCKGLARC